MLDYDFKFKQTDVIHDKSEPLGKWMVIHRFIDVDNGDAFYSLRAYDNVNRLLNILASTVEMHYDFAP
jgi:hypothetical protein